MVVNLLSGHNQYYTIDCNSNLCRFQNIVFLGPIYTLVVKHQGARLPSIRVYPVPSELNQPSIFCGFEDHTNHKWPMTIVLICFNPFVNGISHEERGLTHQVY